MLVLKDFHKVHYETLAIEKLLGESQFTAGKGATQKVYMFKNGYGASVVNGFMSFGLDELAVIHFHNPYKVYRSKSKRLKKKSLKQAGNWSLSYSTPITSEVKRYTDQSELNRDLTLISKLNKAGQF